MNGTCSEINTSVDGVETLSKSKPMRISLLAMFVWVFASSTIAGLLGWYPTWQLAGRAGLRAGFWAVIVVVPLMIVSGILTFLASRKSLPLAAIVFTATGMIRMIVCCALAAAVIFTQDVPKMTTVLWVGIFYVAALAGEGAWLAKAMKRSARIEALGADHKIDDF